MVLKYEDISVGDLLKITNPKGIGVKVLLLASENGLRESYRVYETSDNDGEKVILLDAGVNEDGKTITGVLFEKDLEHVELVSE